MITTYRDQVVELWEPLPPFPGTLLPNVMSTNMNRDFVHSAMPSVLHRIIGCVTFDIARRLDGVSMRRPDILAELLFRLQDSPQDLDAHFDSTPVVNSEQRACFMDIIKKVLESNTNLLVGEVRTPWNDEDLRLFAKRLLAKTENEIHGQNIFVH